MINFAEILNANPVGVFATQDGNKVKTRVFQYLFADGKMAYFSTSSEKPVYAQIQANPNVSFCTHPQNFDSVLSISGKAVFVEDNALKVRAFDVNPKLKGMYKSADNPVFRIFYIEVEEVTTFSFADGPKSYKM
jgi:uncharacterized pyridoxamine 5'-phosphate oxidase family protein